VHQLLIELVDDPGVVRGAIRLGVGRVNGVSRYRPATGGRGPGWDSGYGGIPSPQIGAKTANRDGEKAGADSHQGKVTPPNRRVSSFCCWRAAARGNLCHA
jgi:hypothetical protein